MEHTNMGHSIIQICLKLMHLPLKKTNHCITLHYLSTMLQSLMLKLCNGMIPPSNGILKSLNLGISQTKTSLKTLGQVYHLVHVSLLKYLVVGLSIHISGHSMNSLIRYITN